MGFLMHIYDDDHRMIPQNKAKKCQLWDQTIGLIILIKPDEASNAGKRYLLNTNTICNLSPQLTT